MNTAPHSAIERVNTMHPANAFDFVRLVAAFGVLLSHSFRLNLIPQPFFSALADLGTLCVYVFFAVSGYLVCQSWNRNPTVGAFVWNRFLRIYPGLFVCVVLTAFFLGSAVTTLSLFSYLTSSLPYRYVASALVMLFQPPHLFIHTVFEGLPYPRAINGSIWTIRLEIGMYAVLLFLLAASRRATFLIALCFVSCIVMWIGALLLGMNDPRSLFYGLTRIGIGTEIFEFGPFFLMGSLLSGMPARFFNSRGALVAALLMISVAPTLYGTPALWILLPYCVITFAIRAPGLFQRAGKHGDFSYGFYLYGFPVQQAVIYLGVASWWQQLLPAIFITMLFAFLSWHFVESPALRFKRRAGNSVPPASSLPAAFAGK